MTGQSSLEVMNPDGSYPADAHSAGPVPGRRHSDPAVPEVAPAGEPLGGLTSDRYTGRVFFSRMTMTSSHLKH